MPEWAHVWFWLRFTRGVMTPLPQEEHDDPMAMSMDEYENYHGEWLQAGAPKASAMGILAAMGSNPLHEEVPF